MRNQSNLKTYLQNDLEVEGHLLCHVNNPKKGKVGSILAQHPENICKYCKVVKYYINVGGNVSTNWKVLTILLCTNTKYSADFTAAVLVGAVCPQVSK